MIELSENEFKKLKKDADDNNQLKSIIRFVVLVIVGIILYCTLILPFVNDYIHKQEEYSKHQMAIDDARTSVEIREIEQGSMSMDEYLKWLSVRKD